MYLLCIISIMYYIGASDTTGFFRAPFLVLLCQRIPGCSSFAERLRRGNEQSVTLSGRTPGSHGLRDWWNPCVEGGFFSS